jgi:hypothetical protein
LFSHYYKTEEDKRRFVMGMHAFADHLELIDLLAAPLQWVWPSAASLLLFQATATIRFRRVKYRMPMGDATLDHNSRRLSVIDREPD